MEENKNLKLIVIIIIILAVVIIAYISMTNNDEDPLIGSWNFVSSETALSHEMEQLSFNEDGTGSFRTNSTETISMNWEYRFVVKPGIWINETVSGDSRSYTYELSDDGLTLTLINSYGADYIFSRIVSLR